MEQALVKFSVTDAAIFEMNKMFMPLTINGIDDKAGYVAVRTARLQVKSKRVEVEKQRKEMKADALEYGRKVDAEALRVVQLLSPIEEHLEAQEVAIDEQKEAIRIEKERALNERTNSRIQTLQEVGYPIDVAVLAQMPESDFQILVEKAALAYVDRKQVEEAEAEHQRQLDAIAETVRTGHEETLRIERERQAQIAAEQKTAQDKIDADRKAIEDEKQAFENQRLQEEAEKKRAAELELARIEAAEKARIETELRIQQEQAMRDMEERQAKEEEERLASLRPDREKILALADLLEEIVFPNVTSNAAVVILKAHQATLTTMVANLRKFGTKKERK